MTKSGRPRMSRWHYRTIGAAIRAADPALDANTDMEKSTLPGAVVGRAVAEVFAADSPRFDRKKFLRFIRTGKEKA